MLSLRVVLTVGLMAFALALAGCVAATQEQPSGQAEGQRLQPKKGGVLRTASTANTNNLNFYLHSGSARNPFFDHVYEPFFAAKYIPRSDFVTDEPTRWDYRVEEGIVPWLVESWESASPSTYLFKVRPGVKWSDGQDLTSADFVFTFDHLLENKAKYRTAAPVLAVQSAEALDRQTVRVTLTKPDPDFLSGLRDNIVVLPEHIGDRGESFEKVAVGTGPFLLKDFSSTTGGKFARNDGYWDQPRPHPQGSIVFFGLSRDAMGAAFVTGELDFLLPANAGQFTTIRTSLPNAPFQPHLAEHGWVVYFNMAKPPFNDIRVRRAMHLAIDRQAMHATINQGTTDILNAPGVPGWNTRWALAQADLVKLPGYNPSTKEKDIAEAKKLLADAGYPNGFKTVLTYSSETTSVPPIAEMASAQLRQIGIQVDLRPQEIALAADTLVKGDYDLYITSTVSSGATLYVRFWEKFHTQGTYSKPVGIGDRDLDNLIDPLSRPGSHDERIALVNRIQQHILDKMYAVSTIDIATNMFWQPWIHDYIYNRGTQVKPFFMPAIIWIDTDLLPEKRKEEAIK